MDKEEEKKLKSKYKRLERICMKWVIESVNDPSIPPPKQLEDFKEAYKILYPDLYEQFFTNKSACRIREVRRYK